MDGGRPGTGTGMFMSVRNYTALTVLQGKWRTVWEWNLCGTAGLYDILITDPRNEHRWMKCVCVCVCVRVRACVCPLDQDG